MAVDRGLAEAVRGVARGAANARVRVRALTTHQVRWGATAADAVASGGATAPAALTAEGSEGGTVTHFMVGKDTLDDADVQLG